MAKLKSPAIIKFMIYYQIYHVGKKHLSKIENLYYLVHKYLPKQPGYHPINVRDKIRTIPLQSLRDLYTLCAKRKNLCLGSVFTFQR